MKTFSVTIGDIIQLDVACETSEPKDILDSTYLTLKNLNVSLSCFELDSEPQILATNVTIDNITWEELNTPEDYNE